VQKIIVKNNYFRYLIHPCIFIGQYTTERTGSLSSCIAYSLKWLDNKAQRVHSVAKNEKARKMHKKHKET